MLDIVAIYHKHESQTTGALRRRNLVDGSVPIYTT